MKKGVPVSIKPCLSTGRNPKGKLPSLPFQLLKNEILGHSYELSIVFADKQTSQSLNRRWRGKNKPTNILSFSLSKNAGELIIHLPTVKKEKGAFGMNFKNFLGLIIIHGMLHLKGMQHSSKMEVKERQFCKRFGFK